VLHVVKFYDPYSRCFSFRQIHKFTRSCDGVCDFAREIFGNETAPGFSLPPQFPVVSPTRRGFPHDPFIEGLILSDEMTSVLFNRWPSSKYDLLAHFLPKIPISGRISVPEHEKDGVALLFPSDQISLVFRI
jgi:hypothetical protein